MGERYQPPWHRCKRCNHLRPPNAVEERQGIYTCLDRVWCKAALDSYDSKQDTPVPLHLRNGVP